MSSNSPAWVKVLIMEEKWVESEGVTLEDAEHWAMASTPDVCRVLASQWDPPEEGG